MEKLRKLVFANNQLSVWSLLLLFVFSVSVKADLKVSGRVQVDYDNTKADGVSRDNIDFRRIWINANSTHGNWKYLARFDLQADKFNNDAIVDLTATYSGFGKGSKLTIGRQKTQFGLSWISSNAALNFAERSSVVELFKFGRMEGITYTSNIGAGVVYSVGVYDQKGTSSLASIARITYSNTIGANEYLHVGAGAGVTKSRNTYNAEFAYAKDAFHIQLEYFSSRYDKPDTSSDKGYYIEAGYFLNRTAARPYKKGKYSRVKPIGKNGDWQVVARYENGDGNFSDLGLNKVNASACGLGLNWYVHNNMAFFLSYVRGTTNDQTILSERLKGRELRARLQYLF